MSRTNKDDSKSSLLPEDGSSSVSASASTTGRSADTSSSDISSGSIGREDSNITSPSDRVKCLDASSPTTDSIELGTLTTESSSDKAEYHAASTSKLMKVEEKANVNSPGKKRKCTEPSISDTSTVDSMEKENSSEGYKRLKSTTSTSEEILDVLKELVNGQKTLNDRLSAIENTLSSNRSQMNENFASIERNHSVIIINQGSLLAAMENLGNTLAVVNRGGLN